MSDASTELGLINYGTELDGTTALKFGLNFSLIPTTD